MTPAKLSLTTIRNFATSAVNGQLIKAPIQLFNLEGRYASALYSAAVKQKELEAVEKDLVKLEKTLATDVVLKEFLASPVISKPIKVNAVKEISSKLSFTNSSSNLLAVLADNGRLKNLPNVISSFGVIMAAHRGDLTIEVTAAKPLDDAARQELDAVLKKFAKKGENIKLMFNIDPSIIGGLIVSIGDRYIDMSIANKVKRYSDALTSAV